MGKREAPARLAGVLNLIVEEGGSRDGNVRAEGLCLAQHLGFLLEAGKGLQQTNAWRWQPALGVDVHLVSCDPTEQSPLRSRENWHR